MWHGLHHALDPWTNEVNLTILAENCAHHLGHDEWREALSSPPFFYLAFSAMT
jgi:hypothetical protein